MSEDCDSIEPSAAEQYLWPEATQNYVRDLEARIEELEDFAQLVIEEFDVAALDDCESGVASASARAASEYLTDFRHTREAIHKIKDGAAELLKGTDDL